MYEYLHGLAMRASKGRASEYRAIWNEWHYSDLVEYLIGANEERAKMWDEINTQDFESSEGYTLALLSRVLDKM